MIPWFILYPAIGAALGGGGAKATGHDWKKGALLGAGAGLGAGALPLAGGATAGGTAGWGELISGTALGGTTPASAAAAAQWSPNAFGAALGKGAGTLMGTGSGAGAHAATEGALSGAAKKAAASAAMSAALQASMPQYGQSQLLMQPGPMQGSPDMTAELMQMMRMKGMI